MSSGSFPIVQFTQNGSSVLPPLNFMLPGQYLESPSKQYKLIFEADANLVLYDNGVKIWVADSATPYTYVDSRPDPSYVNCVVMYSSLRIIDHVHNRLWVAQSSWIPVPNQAAAPARAYLQVQDDGNVIVVDGVPTWARFGFTPTAEPRPGKLIYDTGTNKGPSYWKMKDWTFNNVF